MLNGSSTEQKAAGEPVIAADAVELLRAIRHDIDQVLTPELSSPMAMMVARMASEVLTNLIGEQEHLPAIRSDYVAERLSTIRQALDLGGRLGVDDPELRHEVTAVAEAARTSASSEQTRRTVDALLERLVGPLMGAAARGTAEDRKAMEDLMRAIVATTATYQSRMAEAAAREKAADIAMHDEMRATVTPERLEAYWHARFPESPDARITALRELSGGFGKTTILFDVEGWEDAPASLVMRRDVLGGATETSVVDEFPVLRTAFKYGLPVPEPLFLEADAAKLDRPFLIVRRVPGVPAGNFWNPSPDCTPQLGRDLARALATLHAIDPAEFGLGSPGTGQDQAGSYFQSWREATHRKQARSGPDPALELALCWLEQNMPPPPERLSFVHSDPGFWNILMHDGKISALLDWELGHFGDPAEDISYVKSSIETFMPWQDFLDAYREAGGAEYQEERGEFYAVWRDVRNAILSDFAAHAFWTGANPELRMAHCGVMSSKQVLTRGVAHMAELGLVLPGAAQPAELASG